MFSKVLVRFIFLSILLIVPALSKEEIKIAGLSVIGGPSRGEIESNKKINEDEEVDEKSFRTVVPKLIETKTATPTSPNIPLTEDEIILLLMEKHKGTVVGKFLDSNPRLARLTVKITLDEKIRNLWLETFKNRTRYYIFMAFFILSAIFGLFWGRFSRNTQASALRSILSWVLRFTVINFARVGLFFYLFRVEIAPIWDLAKKVFYF